MMTAASVLYISAESCSRFKKVFAFYQQGDDTLNERYQIMLEQKERTLKEMEDLKIRLEVLNRKVDHYGKSLNGEEDAWGHKYMQNLI